VRRQRHRRQQAAQRVQRGLHAPAHGLRRCAAPAGPPRGLRVRVEHGLGQALRSKAASSSAGHCSRERHLAGSWLHLTHTRGLAGVSQRSADERSGPDFSHHDVHCRACKCLQVRHPASLTGRTQAVKSVSTHLRALFVQRPASSSPAAAASAEAARQHRVMQRQVPMHSLALGMGGRQRQEEGGSGPSSSREGSENHNSPCSRHRPQAGAVAALC